MYSQHEEERFILGACSELQTGRFLDIGAYHPKIFSNTRALYERGWGGVMVEPAPSPMRALLEEYGTDSRIRLVHAAVAINPGLLLMQMSDDCLSTSSWEFYQRWKAEKQFLGEALAPAITWEHLQQEFGLFHFVNIDVEGFSANLFLRMLELRIFPLCCCVEADGEAERLCNKARQAGYQSIYQNNCNIVFERGNAA